MSHGGPIGAVEDEFLRLAGMRESFRSYVREVALSRPGYVDGEHIHLICDTVQAFLEGDARGLIVTMPPRHMKSTILSECLPAWLISKDPAHREVIVASYDQAQADKMSRACRAIFDEPAHRRAFPGQAFAVDSVREWMLAGKVNSRPSFISAGVGVGITGSGADLAIVDDPVKDAASAASAKARDTVSDWYRWVLESRLSPGGKRLVVMTRWHHDDLVGRLLRDDPDGWQLLHLPAISDAGEALWPERYSIDELELKRRALGSRAFEAQYQGRPTPLMGGMFRREWVRDGRPLPEDAVRVRYWDKAATHAGGDWTVGTLMARRGEEYCIEDVVRIQGSPYEVESLILRTAERDGRQVRIRMEQEPGSSGADVIAHYSRLLRGWAFRPDKVTGAKAIRAEALAAAMEAGAVTVCGGSWRRDWEDELTEFPLGAHDDQVDSASGAFNHLAGKAQGPAVAFF